MCQISKCRMWCLLIGICCLCGCAKETDNKETVTVSDYLNEEALEADKEKERDSYIIEDAFEGTFVVEYEANAQFYIQDSQAVYADYEYGTLLFDEFMAEAGDYLEAGDVIANVHIEVSEADLAEARLKLQRMQERMESDRILFEKEDNMLEKDAYDIKNFEARGVAIRLYMESVELHKQDIEMQNKQIGEAKENLAEMEAAAAMTKITAPVAGYLKDVPVLAYGDEIPDGKILGVLEPKKSSILLVNNEENAFRYGKEVTVICKKGAEETEFSGKVITPSQKSIALQAGDKKAGILLEEAGSTYLLENDVNSVLVKVNTIEQEHAVMVKIGALEEGNSAYATVIQEDGSFLKKRVVIGGKNKEYYWVIKGLNAGEQVVVP
ncbi:MAG: hypothetical protein IJ274_03570 [Lachnospiraceae bacterium]|nr:hypothetical protein [Lachnospiraceae bacterium]